jgi:hypothetical protein
MNQQEDQDVRQILLRYRMANLPLSLRQRALGGLAVQPCVIASDNARYAWLRWLYRGAVAAMLLVALVLHQASERTNTEIMQSIGIGPAQWTQQVEEIAELVEPQGISRQYLASMLTTDIGAYTVGQGDLQ